MSTEIDHLVIGAETLEQGVSYVQHQLGVEIPPGGEHLQMGTHNHLMQLGEHCFLEVIAINPDLSSPSGPRWYGLDDPYVRQQLAQQPSLLTWVVNTADIKQLLQQARFDFGRAQTISRGTLSWDFGLPEDGRLLAGGMLPYAIEWHAERHPAGAMADLGCRLVSIEIYHPRPVWFKDILVSIGASTLVQVHPQSKNAVPYMVATLQTPLGVRELRTLVWLSNQAHQD